MGSMSGVEAASMPLLPEWLRMLWVAHSWGWPPYTFGTPG